MCYFNYYEYSSNTGIIKFVRDSGSSAACGYSSSTGIFTTQIPGLYYFAIHVVGGDSDTRVQILIDGKYGCEAWSPDVSGTHYQGTATCSVVRELKENQKVHVEVLTGRIGWSSSTQNIFQGFLVR